MARPLRIEFPGAFYLAYREGRYTQKQIGDHLGLHYVTISRVFRGIEQAKRGS